MKTLMIIVAHPDDEVLGCGGYVAKLISEKWSSACIILSSGISGRIEKKTSNIDIKSKQNKLIKESLKAHEALGIQNSIFFDLPDNKLDTISKLDISIRLKKEINKFKPDLILTHHPGDYNWDHKITFEATLMASRPSPDEVFASEIKTFEVISSTERSWLNNNPFVPDTFVDIENFINKKINSFQNYKSEIKKYPHPRSKNGILNLAKYRGNQVGLKYAEAFTTIKKIIN